MIDFENILRTEETLDPNNWEDYKTLAHQMIEDIFQFLSSVSQQPVWQKTPHSVKDNFKKPLPKAAENINTIYKEFQENILPFRKGNIHPRFFSWVEGNGTITGVLGDMLASAMNSNLGIGDHSAVYVEHQVIDWCKQIVGFPSTASGTLVAGGSIANITALIVARNAFQGGIIKKGGLKKFNQQLVMYCSSETHSCIFKAAETIGIGSDHIRKISVNERYQIDLDLLITQIDADKKDGLIPFCIAGNAGTVNTGAIDPFAELLAICRRENMWLHADGAIGGVLALLPEYKEQLKGMEEADSIAFDLHKWLYVNYEVGCVLIKDAEANKNAFSQQAAYLLKHDRGLAAGPDSFSNYSLDLSKSFKSLKVWMSLKEHGIEKFSRLIRQNIAQAFYMEHKITESPLLELLTPVTLNIVCYRFNPGYLENDELNLLNKEILMRMQEQGIAAPSYTLLKDCYAIRVSITNHRTKMTDLDAVVKATVTLGEAYLKEKGL